MSRAFIGFLFAAAWLTACGDGGLGGGNGDGCTSLLYGTADELSLDLSTSERLASRYLMVVGELGRARANFSAGGVSIGGPNAALRSSDPSVLRVGHDGSTETVTAVGAGSATITAEGCGLSDVVSVQVSAAPLPIDALQVYAISGWPGKATKDPNGNLLSLALAVGESTPLGVLAMRAGEGVIGGALLPVVASNNAAVAEIMIDCRPPELDPGCGVYSDAWIVARSVGSAEMAVTVRNITWRFQVQVTTP